MIFETCLYVDVFKAMRKFLTTRTFSQFNVTHPYTESKGKNHNKYLVTSKWFDGVLFVLCIGKGIEFEQQQEKYDSLSFVGHSLQNIQYYVYVETCNRTTLSVFHLQNKQNIREVDIMNRNGKKRRMKMESERENCNKITRYLFRENNGLQPNIYMPSIRKNVAHTHISNTQRRKIIIQMMAKIYYLCFRRFC